MVAATPADGDATGASTSRWTPRPGPAGTLDVVATLAPVLAAAAAAVATGWLLGRPTGPAGVAVRWAVVAAAAAAVLVVAGRAARRLHLLAALLRLPLAFPGPAPSRWRVSRRAAARPTTEPPATADAAAEQLVALAVAGEHDRGRRGHAPRVADYADLIAVDLGIAPADRDRLRWAALLHGLRLDAEASEHLVAPLRPWSGPWLGGPVEHPEPTDGDPAPRGHDIQTAGHILEVAGAYDAMTSPPAGRSGMAASEAGAELLRHRGTRFDPDAVRALLHVPAERRRVVAGPSRHLARVPTIRRWVLAADRPAVRAAAALTVAAVASVATGSLALPAPVESTAAAAPTPTITATPSPDSAEDPTSTTGGTTGPADRPRNDPPPPAGPGDAATTTTEGRHASTGTSGVPAMTAPSAKDSLGRPPSTTEPPTTTEPPSTEPPTTTEPPSTEPPTEPPTSDPPTTDPPTTTLPPNPPPVAEPDTESVRVLSTTVIDVLANDTDDTRLDSSSLTITSVDGSGSATVQGGRIRFTAPPLPGTTEIGYRVCDEQGACATAVLTITIRLL